MKILLKTYLKALTGLVSSPLSLQVEEELLISVRKIEKNTVGMLCLGHTWLRQWQLSWLWYQAWTDLEAWKKERSYS